MTSAYFATDGFARPPLRMSMLLQYRLQGIYYVQDQEVPQTPRKEGYEGGKPVEDSESGSGVEDSAKKPFWKRVNILEVISACTGLQPD